MPCSPTSCFHSYEPLSTADKNRCNALMVLTHNSKKNIPWSQDNLLPRCPVIDAHMAFVRPVVWDPYLREPVGRKNKMNSAWCIRKRFVWEAHPPRPAALQHAGVSWASTHQFNRTLSHHKHKATWVEQLNSGQSDVRHLTPNSQQSGVAPLDVTLVNDVFNSDSKSVVASQSHQALRGSNTAAASITAEPTDHHLTDEAQAHPSALPEHDIYL